MSPLTSYRGCKPTRCNLLYLIPAHSQWGDGPGLVGVINQSA